MQWESSLVLVAAFNAVGELSRLDRSGTVTFLDFSILKFTVFGSALQLEPYYGVVALLLLFPPKLSVCQK